MTNPARRRATLRATTAAVLVLAVAPSARFAQAVWEGAVSTDFTLPQNFVGGTGVSFNDVILDTAPATLATLATNGALSVEWTAVSAGALNTGSTLVGGERLVDRLGADGTGTISATIGLRFTVTDLQLSGGEVLTFGSTAETGIVLLETPPFGRIVNQINIAGGTLTAGLIGANSLLSSALSVAIVGRARLDFGKFDATLNDQTGAGTVTTRVARPGSVTLTGTLTLKGVFADGNGPISLVCSGAGKTTLTGASSRTGTISGGLTEIFSDGTLVVGTGGNVTSSLSTIGGTPRGTADATLNLASATPPLRVRVHSVICAIPVGVFAPDRVNPPPPDTVRGVAPAPSLITLEKISAAVLSTVSNAAPAPFVIPPAPVSSVILVASPFKLIAVTLATTGGMPRIDDDETVGVSTGTGGVILSKRLTLSLPTGTLGQHSGQIFGADGLTVTGPGFFKLSSNNTYDGVTIVGARPLIDSASALCSTVGGTDMRAGGTLSLAGGINVGPEVLTFVGTGFGGSGALRNDRDDNTFAGAVTLTSAALIRSVVEKLILTGNVVNSGFLLSVDGRGKTQFDGVVSGTGGLTVTDGSTILTNANSYLEGGGRLFINGGTLTLGGHGDAIFARFLDGAGGITKRGGVALTSGGSLASNLVEVRTDGRLMSAGEASVRRLNNAGVVTRVTSVAGDLRVLTTDYVGVGGTLMIDLALGAAGSTIVKLRISGASSGTTDVLVTNAGGVGGQTVDGIKVIETGTSTPTAFRLGAPVSVGSFDYGLTRNADGQDWYLISSGLSASGVAFVNAPLVITEGFNTHAGLGARSCSRQGPAPQVTRGPAFRTTARTWVRVYGDALASTSRGSIPATIQSSNWGVEVGRGFDGAFGGAGAWTFGDAANQGSVIVDVAVATETSRISGTGVGIAGSATWNGFWRHLCRPAGKGFGDCRKLYRQRGMAGDRRSDDGLCRQHRGRASFQPRGRAVGMAFWSM